MTEVKSLFKEKCYLNGQWRDASDGRTFEVINPATNERIASVPYMGRIEALEAVTAAHKALGGWRKLSVNERSHYLRKWFDLMMAYEEDLGKILTLEQGKPLAEARGEIRYGASYIEWYAEEAKRIYGDTMPASRADQRILITKEPIGVCTAITPWNFPNAMITRKIAPAIAAGCTIVVKPAGETPLSAFAIAELADRAGIPKGVINILTGDAVEIGKVLTEDERVRKFSFTGSTEVGRLLMKQCASTIKKTTMELGGNAPFIVFDDADLDEAIVGAIASKYRNSGQTCVCANRFYVHVSIYDEFVERFKEAVARLKLGNGLTTGVELGPLIDEKAVVKVKKHIDDVLTKGGSLVLGGEVDEEQGPLFFKPTILRDVTQKMQVSRDETFGPLAPIFKFETEDEVIGYANDTEFGLASYLFTRDLGRVIRVSEALEYGMVAVNTGMLSNAAAPFGGIKQSGLGREGSKYGIEDYLEIKYTLLAGI